MSEQEQLHLLATDGMLVKRPILIGENFVLVGFREKEWETVLHIWKSNKGCGKQPLCVIKSLFFCDGFCFLFCVFCFALQLGYGRQVVFRKVRLMVAFGSVRIFRIRSAHSGFCHFVQPLFVMSGFRISISRFYVIISIGFHKFRWRLKLWQACHPIGWKRPQERQLVPEHSFAKYSLRSRWLPVLLQKHSWKICSFPAVMEQQPYFTS